MSLVSECRLWWQQQQQQLKPLKKLNMWIKNIPTDSFIIREGRERSMSTSVFYAEETIDVDKLVGKYGNTRRRNWGFGLEARKMSCHLYGPACQAATGLRTAETTGIEMLPKRTLRFSNQEKNIIMKIWGIGN